VYTWGVNGRSHPCGPPDLVVIPRRPFAHAPALTPHPLVADYCIQPPTAHAARSHEAIGALGEEPWASHRAESHATDCAESPTTHRAESHPADSSAIEVTSDYCWCGTRHCVHPDQFSPPLAGADPTRPGSGSGRLIPSRLEAPGRTPPEPGCSRRRGGCIQPPLLSTRLAPAPPSGAPR
jgi:hypothetical protein